jgi:hypothetical protein
MNSNSWVGQQWKSEIRRGPNGKPEPLPEPVAPNKQIPPGNTVPSQDIPTASTTRSKPMGLTSVN